MPWIYVVNGAAVSFNTKEPYEEAKKIQSTVEFKALNEQCKALDLTLSFAQDTNDNKLSIFLGIDLHADRHICTGACQVMSHEQNLPEGFDALVDQLHAFVKTINEEASLQRGLVVNPFD